MQSILVKLQYICSFNIRVLMVVKMLQKLSTYQIRSVYLDSVFYTATLPFVE